MVIQLMANQIEVFHTSITHMQTIGRIFLCLLCIGAAALDVRAQAVTKIAQIDGGAVSSLCSNKFGDLYCSALNQVYRSIDQGQSWQKQKSPVDSLINIQLVAPNDQNSLTALFAVAGGRVWKSTDDGQRWSSAPALDAYVDANSLQNLFSTRYGWLMAAVRTSGLVMLLRSRDNGISFDTACTLPAAVSSVVQAPDSTLYVSADRCYRVDVSGTATAIGSMRVVVTYQEFFNAPIAVWAIDNNTPFRSVNRGAEWKNLAIDPKDTGTLFEIVIDREANAYAFTRTSDSTSIYRLTNGSTSWTKVRTIGKVLKEVLANINGTFVASTDNGIYSSEDNGSSWTRTSRGISTYPLSCAVQSENVVCVSGFDGVLSQTNTGGFSWSTANVPQSRQPLVINELVRTSGGKIVAATSDGIWTSSDLGLNYIAALLSNATVQPVHSVTEVAPGVLYATAQNGLLRSNDDGVNWFVVDTTSFSGASLAWASKGSFVVSTERGVFSGDTSSRVLTLISVDLSLGRTAINKNGTVYTAGYGIGIPGTYPVVVNRKKTSMPAESVIIPSTKASSLIPVWVATGTLGEAYVNTDAGLYRLNENSTTPERIDIPGEICTYVHSSGAGTVILATVYGGVYTLDVSSSVEDTFGNAPSAVWPQPANEFVSVHASGVVETWSVVDIHGRVCDSGVLNSAGCDVRVSTQHLANGVYACVARLQSGAHVRVPFVVSH